MSISPDLKSATLHVENLPLVDSFVFLGDEKIPATVSLDVTFDGSGRRNRYRPGSDDPMDPTNFDGKFREGVATARFSGSNSEGFRFRSDLGATSEGIFAEIGLEKNGVFVD